MPLSAHPQRFWQSLHNFCGKHARQTQHQVQDLSSPSRNLQANVAKKLWLPSSVLPSVEDRLHVAGANERATPRKSCGRVQSMVLEVKFLPHGQGDVAAESRKRLCLRYTEGIGSTTLGKLGIAGAKMSKASQRAPSHRNSRISDSVRPHTPLICGMIPLRWTAAHEGIAERGTRFRAHHAHEPYSHQS